MKKNSDYKIALLIVVLLGFYILMAQAVFHFSNERNLKGSFTPKEKPSFEASSWFTGNYQDSLNDFANENFGFRSFFVRLNNQLEYSLFNNAKANGVIVGKEGYLYEKNYITAYLGEDFVGDSTIAQKISKLEEIQKRLKKRDIDLILVFAPGKASFYPEYIPDQFDRKKTKTNYEGYVNALTNTKINFINLNQWFIELKGKTIAPLYPKTGIHWSRFGELKVGDSILNYIEKIRGINLPKFNFTDTLFSTKTKFTDADIEQGMNLLFDIEDLEMAYPSFNVIRDANTQSTRAMVVGDSYYWGLYNHGFATDFLSNGQFWFYFKEINEIGKEKQLVKNVDIKNEIQKHNVVILMVTEANLSDFAFGFIESAYTLFNLPLEQEKEERIKLMERNILHTKNWYEDIKLMAKEKGISVERAVRKNAEYMIWVEDEEALRNAN